MSAPESNGRKPAEADQLEDAPAADDELDDEPSSGLEIAFTPRQILGGFVLLAALIALLRQRQRDRKR
jgi:hypothetical protein